MTGDPKQGPGTGDALPDPLNLEREMVAALRQIATDPKAQTAARATAAKAVLDWASGDRSRSPAPGSEDPGDLSLEDIESRLARL